MKTINGYNAGTVSFRDKQDELHKMPIMYNNVPESAADVRMLSDVQLKALLDSAISNHKNRGLGEKARKELEKLVTSGELEASSHYAVEFSELFTVGDSRYTKADRENAMKFWEAFAKLDDEGKKARIATAKAKSGLESEPLDHSEDAIYSFGCDVFRAIRTASDLF